MTYDVVRLVMRSVPAAETTRPPPLERVNMGAARPVIFAFSLPLSQQVSMKHALVRWMTPKMALATCLNNVLYAI